MCLILLAYQRHPHYRLIVAANRDEFFDRPTAPLDYWPDQPDILAGRDLQQGGTWMGVTRGGRFAAITNYRDPKIIKSHAPSRGRLVADFLAGSMTPSRYMAQVESGAPAYNGFNLLVGDRQGLFYYSNFSKGIQELTPGVHGLSNHLLDTPWPKVERGKRMLADALPPISEPSEEAIMDMLQDRTPASEEDLPRTGVDPAWERMLSPIFITSPTYGTRCSSVLLFHKDGRIRFQERTWQGGQPSPVATACRRFYIPSSAH